YPGAFADIDGARVIVNKAIVIVVPGASAIGGIERVGQVTRTGDQLGFVCGDGHVLVPLSLTVDGETLAGAETQRWLAAQLPRAQR
ncbi:MAG TPA: hypothetical protein PLK42_13505, partial [Casimicrobium sp.]|nr:hypothetical protein [Casimicrobium sp.]